MLHFKGKLPTRPTPELVERMKQRKAEQEEEDHAKRAHTIGSLWDMAEELI